MGPPRASKNFEQKQPITTTLRTICESYPPNTSLRELLQNADDARASEIEFVLDTKTHAPSGPLLHEELSEYNGPALLARNNSKFTDRDFESLSSVGDSGKRNDPETVGKFGQGFNSVFHWTDGPQIYSRDTLLLLDPHHRWSRDTNKPGGPAWDVVANQNCPEIQNQLRTLNVFKFDPSKEFPETIIRIPLRTQSQAEQSKIKQHAPSLEEIGRVLQQFCHEIESGGLLFLKNIRKVVVRADDRLLLNAHIVNDDVGKTQKRDTVTSSFRDLYGHSPTSKTDAYVAFETKVRYEKDHACRTETYLIQHYLAPTCGDSDLDDWAKGWKLFPWVAVAAPVDRGHPFVGRLFSTLQLPIETSQPVHIHALFAIAPDRARLGHEDSAFSWNELLFKNFISKAWARLLEHRNTISFREECFGLWPAIGNPSNDPWTRLSLHVLDQIMVSNACVWNASTQECVTFGNGYFAEENPENLRRIAALAEVQAPGVLLSPPLYHEVLRWCQSNRTSMKALSPSGLRLFLRGKPLFASAEAQSTILEFLISDATNQMTTKAQKEQVYADLHDIHIWPTLDEMISVPGQLMMPRDRQESELFSGARNGSTIDIVRLSSRTQTQVARDISLFKGAIRYRSLDDLNSDWFFLCPNSGNGKRSVEVDGILRKIWEWILAREREGESLSSIQSLWIIPLRGSNLRPLQPHGKKILTLIIEDRESLAKTVYRLAKIDANPSPQILDLEVLGTETISFLRLPMSRTDVFNLTTQEDVVGLVEWLFTVKDDLSRLSVEDKIGVLNHLSMLMEHWAGKAKTSESMKDRMLQLPIYTRTVCPRPCKKRSPSVGSLYRMGSIYQLPKGLPPLPDIPTLCLCDPSNEYEKRLLRSLAVVESDSSHSLLVDHLLPWMHSTAEGVDEELKTALVEWIFTESKLRPMSWMSEICSQPLIPLKCRNPGTQKLRGGIRDVIDPNSFASKMFFDFEGLFPEPAFLARHDTTLSLCGMTDGLSFDTPLTRARFSSKFQGNLADLSEKLSCLFQTKVSPELLSQPDLIEEIRDLNWIPGCSPSGAPVLHSPKKCRDTLKGYLVSHVWGTTAFNVKAEWQSLLGWDQAIPNTVLLEQLDHIINGNDVPNLTRILPHLTAIPAEALCSKLIIVGSQGELFPPSNVFWPGITLKNHSLSPYLDRVDKKFAETLTELLSRLSVRAEPSVQDLRRIQDQIFEQGAGVLSPEQLPVIIQTLEVAALLNGGPEVYSQLLVPDTRPNLVPITEIVHGDRSFSEKFNFAHPQISEALLLHMGIESCFERATRLEIEIEDQDDDEYTPRETLETVITDTLSRYPVEATFNEYLANADDASATTISWILDEGSHSYPSDALLTKELSQLQGPALFVHNDGVFSDEDLKGFKDIGQGGKKADPSSTGMFGRGALSMYHFTDVPMILSADFLLILDPQQQILPRNKFFRRKVGQKLSLSRVRHIAPDQLTPFYGIEGFDKELDFYDGTIFRFPLRSSHAASNLKDATDIIDVAKVLELLQNYLKVAQSSLIFLSNVEKIAFNIRGKSNAEWVVNASKPESGAGDVYSTVFVNVDKGRTHKSRYEWRVGINDVEGSPPDIFKTGKAQSKATECGIAACIRIEDAGSEKQRSTALQCPQRVFCRLPTEFDSSLPVSFHASFAITGDRRSIPFLDNSPVAKWNQFLLTKSIAKLYLDFLRDLAPLIGVDVYRFWPSFSTLNTKRSLGEYMAESFWSTLTTTDHLSDKLFACVSEIRNPGPQNDLRRTPQKKSRKLHPVTSIQRAQFDFLRLNTSKILHPVFPALGQPLVRLPSRLESGIRAIARSLELNFVDTQWIIKTFSVKENADILDKYLLSIEFDSKVEVLTVIFEVLNSLNFGQGSEDCKLLDGCTILPRPKLDHPLGTLKLINNKDEYHHWNYSASLEEQDLFDFARDLMVHMPIKTQNLTKTYKSDNGSLEPADLLTKFVEAPFNIRQIEAEDVGRFLKLPKCPLQSKSNSADVLHEWIIKFWTFFNRKYDLQDLATLIAIAGFKETAVYRCAHQSAWQYLSHEEFENGPYIVQPRSQEQQEMCRHIPGLMCVDNQCLPKQLMWGEADLGDTSSFTRFLRALERIEKKGQNVKSFMMQGRFGPYQETLSQLTMRFLGASYSPDTPSLQMLRSLPSWERIERPEHESLCKYVSAEDALVCKHSTLILPFVKGVDNFIDPNVVAQRESLLNKLNVAFMTAKDLWQRVCGQIPASFTDVGSRRDYGRMVRYLQINQVDGPVAPAVDGQGGVCPAETLYDHEEETFQLAFTHEHAAHFLHPDLEHLRKYWLDKGLRSRTKKRLFRAEDFLQCVLALERLREVSSHATFAQAAAKVTNYLRYENPEFTAWPKQVWSQISQVPMFAVVKDFSNQRPYRRLKMSQLVRDETHCAFADVALGEDLRITWSQAKQVQIHPAGKVFNLRPRGSRPPVETVYRHLHHLVSIVKAVTQQDVSEYLEDVKACYDYLQSNAKAASQLRDIKNASLWFNLPTTSTDAVIRADLFPNLLSAKNICLNAPDDVGHVKVARNFLIPYEKLLTVLGCESVVQPPDLELSEPSYSTSPTADSLLKIQGFRSNQKLCDVAFTAEGQTIHAHKVILAAASQYCETQFSGPWGQSLSTNPSPIPIADMTFKTLSNLIEYAYTGTFNPPSPTTTSTSSSSSTSLDTIADILDDQLALLVGADRWIMPRLHEEVESYLVAPQNIKQFVRVDNVSAVLTLAESGRAIRLAGWCRDFRERNWRFVREFETMGGAAEQDQGIE